ncbi:hypothetical protein QR680_001975 [Steinernema hermaphroditum]|uniref:Peptidase S54 rhomboid domain-containing protein n=1 Tax=Steinernema hermaphroditum TaxID=289476 RepID=A0AA39LHB2_9BILA|nr:hypothetical protein QR680_001975 [Steinernema hermaphroditum]
MKSPDQLYIRGYQKIPLLPVYTTNKSAVREAAHAQSMSHVPWAMLTLSAVQCILFCWYVPESTQILTQISDSVWPFSASRSLEVWRLLSYSLVHVELQHLICNLSVEVALGIYLENCFGHWHTFCIFALGALTGSLTVGLLNENDILIGASAGVCALIAAVASKQLLHIANRHFSICTIWWIVIFLLTVIIDVASLMQDFTSLYSERSQLVAYFSHLGGSFSGKVLTTF